MADALIKISEPPSPAFLESRSLDFSKDKSADDLYDRINDLRAKLGLSRLEMGFSPSSPSQASPPRSPQQRLLFDDESSRLELLASSHDGPPTFKHLNFPQQQAPRPPKPGSPSKPGPSPPRLL